MRIKRKKEALRMNTASMYTFSFVLLKEIKDENVPLDTEFRSFLSRTFYVDNKVQGLMLTLTTLK
jgi:hypothetical protein